MNMQMVAGNNGRKMICGNLSQQAQPGNAGEPFREAPLPARPRHTHHDYRCFLPDLAGFAV